jgi:calcineurin-like phosphoesterase family protein
MNPWIITDSHLGHEGLTEDGFRPAGFSEKILRAMTNNFKGDPIIHLGDVSFNDDEKWHRAITSLPGKKWLVLGNHDVSNRTSSWFMDKGWDWVGESILKQKIIKLR